MNVKDVKSFQTVIYYFISKSSHTLHFYNILLSSYSSLVMLVIWAFCSCNLLLQNCFTVKSLFFNIPLRLLCASDFCVCPHTVWRLKKVSKNHMKCAVVKVIRGLWHHYHSYAYVAGKWSMHIRMQGTSWMYTTPLLQYVFCGCSYSEVLVWPLLIMKESKMNSEA